MSSLRNEAGVQEKLEKLRRKLHYKAADQETGKLSMALKVMYGAPTLLHQSGAQLMIQLYALTLYESLGMSLATQAAIVAVARSIDVVSDPTMSYITDNFRSSWGRRRPFFAVGCWPYALFLVMLFTPPTWATGGTLTLWFACFYVLFFLINTFCAIPYDALGPELTDNQEERNLVFLFSNLYTMLGLLAGASLPIMIAKNPNLDHYQECYADRNGVFPNEISSACPDQTPGQVFTGWNMSEINPATGLPASESDFRNVAEKALPFPPTLLLCPSTMRGPGDPLLSPPYPNTFPQGYCRCASQCIVNSNIEMTREAATLSALLLGVYYCVTMMISFSLVKERGMDDKEKKAGHEWEPVVANHASTADPTLRKMSAGWRRASINGEDVLQPGLRRSSMKDKGGGSTPRKSGSRSDSSGTATSADAAAEPGLAGANPGNPITEDHEVFSAQPADTAEKVKENAEKVKKNAEETNATKRKPTPLVTGLLNTMNNKPFMQLLPAWMCDSVNLAVLSSLIIYYVMYVVQPEYSNGCFAGDPQDYDNLTFIQANGLCNSFYVAGGALVAILTGAILALPAWLALAKTFGKRNAWLAWSGVNAITNIALFAVQKGQIFPFILIAGINGIPLGASFLSDAILADIIDYDELLTGKRNEATYTMFKSFLPKLCAIPASVIPISLMSMFGYIPPLYAVPQQQPDAVVTYLSIAFCSIPLAFALTSFYIKSKFVMRTNKQVEQIGVGIALRLLSPPKVARCPFSGAELPIFKYEGEDAYWHGILGHFPGVQKIELLQESDGIDQILADCVSERFKAVLSLATFVVLAALATGALISTNFSFVPVLLIVGVGANFIVTSFTFFRKGAADTIAEEMAKPKSERVLTDDLIDKILEERKMLRAVTKFRDIDPTNLNSASLKLVDPAELSL
jgi:Na+/melibiose symporter-like transporter